MFPLLCLTLLGFLSVEAASPPTWPDSVTVGGTLELPYAEIKEPFYAYWDAKHNRSRVDYYGDMVVTIQIGGDGGKNYGSTYKIAPITTETVLNKKTCFLLQGDADGPVTPQSVLPDLSQFKLVGSETVNDQSCDTWEMTNVEGGKKNKYTMWVTSDGTPVRYEMMGYDSLLGSHYDKYYLNYENYNTGKISDDKFSPPVDNPKDCGPFPGPGDAETHALMNPMREFIHNDDTHIEHMFHKFKKTHTKHYKHDIEHTSRKHTFRQNIRFIHSKNRAGLGYSLKVNHLADKSGDELKLMNGRRHTPGGFNGTIPFVPLVEDLPQQMDWRLFGAVTPVKDQAVCGSCWSFGTAGAVEGAYFLRTGNLVRLSQQELMDCSWGEGNNACDGGEDFRAYNWTMQHGLATEEDYGDYLAQDSYCKEKNVTATAKMTGYVKVPSGDLKALKVALAQRGPISVGIDASHRSLSFYANGIYYEPKCGNKDDQLDHAVLAVGYGVQHGKPYWLIKNSWSTYWGNNGYVLMSQKDNNCGVATSATYPVLH